MGLDIEQTAEGIVVCQEHYMDEVEEIMLFDKRNRNSDEPLSTEESRELKKVAGQLSRLASQTRPDLSFYALELNIMKKKLTVKQVSRANKAICMLKRSKTDLVYQNLVYSTSFTSRCLVMLHGEIYLIRCRVPKDIWFFFH